ncbi:MAG: SufS family cysteine desulfurase [bacterium]|nr:SufS family cysteine desulfurase [bacterium]
MAQPFFAKKDFPILARKILDHPLVYLDNAATSQKPQAVLDAITGYYRENNANVHRGVHCLSAEATIAYENARARVQYFISAAKSREIIFTRGTTEGLNLVAAGLAQSLKPGDEIIVSELEHHSNIVPWQVAARQRGARLRVWRLPRRSTDLDLKDLDQLLSARTKVVAITHVSNVLGEVLPVKKIAAMVHDQTQAVVVVDGAQAVGHLPVDVRELDVDYYAFSGHKLYGPTGIGVLYGRNDLLAKLPPYQTGGDMVESVSFERTTYAPLPARFEAGTQNVAGAVGLGAALRYIDRYDLDALAQHERRLAQLARKKLAELPEVHLLGSGKQPTGIVSFVVEGVHPHDVGTVLNQRGVAIRSGLMCAEPLVHALGYQAACRASFAGYNDQHDVEVLVAGVAAAIKLLRA